MLTDVIPIGKETSLCVLNRSKYIISTPILVGISVLETSKRRMSENWYFCLRPMFKSISLCLSDTDSAYFYTEDELFFEKIKANKHLFDSSPYNKNDPLYCDLYSPENESRNGFLRDDYANCIVSEVIALRSKLYSVRFFRRVLNKETGKHEFVHEVSSSTRAKGIPKHKIKDLPFQ